VTTIHRVKIVTEEVEVPDGYMVCPHCKGKGRLTKYDQGWTTFMPDPSFAAPEECYVCRGLGFVPGDTL
jgi:hypothetical protein